MKTGDEMEQGWVQAKSVQEEWNQRVLSQMTGEKKSIDANTNKVRIIWRSYQGMDGKNVLRSARSIQAIKVVKLSIVITRINDTIRKQGHLCSRAPNPHAHPSPSVVSDVNSLLFSVQHASHRA